MAINFPDSPTNGQVALIGGKNYTYNSTKNTWTPTQVTEADLSTVGSTTVVATHDLLPSSPSAGDMALVSSVNKMYVYFLSGWWLMSSLQNASPSGITGNAAIYDLAADGTPTTVTLSSSDPEGFPIVWSHSVISGSLGSTTVTNVNNVFTITPSTDAADAGTFTLRFAAADGQGGESGSQSQFTLDFVFTVTNSRYTTLLATAVGTSDNNNITDSSSNSHSITVNGDTYAGTFSPYRSGGYSTYFDGNDHLTVTHTNPLGTADFTIEGWINFDNVGGNRTLMALDSTTQLYFRNNGSSIAIYKNGSAYNFSTGTPEVNTWYHFAFVRQSGSVTLYWNGQSKGSTSHAHDYTIGNLHIGCWSAISEFFQGHLMDIKISNTAVYTSNFSVPTERLSSDSSTQLITCHLPYIADGSNLAETIVVNGDPSTKPFSPYDYLEYAAADHGGSVYFDGTGDGLVTSTIIPATGNFTIEGWVYSTSTDATQIICGQRTNSGSGRFALEVNAGNIKFYQNGAGSEHTTSNLEALNKWCHFVLMRTSNNLALYVNGERKLNTTSGTFEQTNFEVGTDVELDSLGLNYGLYGFVSDLRVSLSAKYSEGTSVAVPTAPISSTGTELHIKGTDASIIDKSQGSILKLVGSVAGVSSPVKFTNTYSMSFPGFGHWMPVLPETNVKLSGTEDWTVEAWVYPTQRQSYSVIVSCGSSFALALGMMSGNFNVYSNVAGGFADTVVDHGTYDIPANQWTHVAATRYNGIWYAYVDGTLRYTRNYSNEVSHIMDENTQYTIGALDGYSSFSGNERWYGNIQDVRITKGLARYTANFTPPTEPFKG